MGRDKDGLYLVHAGLATGQCASSAAGPRYRFRWRVPYD